MSNNPNILPRCNEVTIPTEKFTKYCLNFEADYNKALAFQKALGYTIASTDELISKIRHGACIFAAKNKGDFGHGTLYEVIMQITGPNGKTASVLTAWIDDKTNE